MGNSGALSSYLSILFPWLLVFYKEQDREVLKYTYILTITLVFLTILISQGRSAWLAVFISSTFLVLLKNKNDLKRRLINLKKETKIVITSLVALVLFFGSVFIFNFKKDSANGRIFIWKRTVEMITDAPLLGVGFGKFGSVYPLYQANYLEKNSDDFARFLANDVSHSFNEYLQIFAELGLLGLFLFLGGFVLIFYYKSKIDNTLLACYGSIIAFLVLSFSTYPFKIFSIQFLVFLCIAIISSKLEKGIVITLNRFKLIFISLCLYFVIFIILNSELTRYSIESSWKEIVSKSKDFKWKTKSKVLKELYNKDHRNWNFLMSYATGFLENEEYDKAITIFLEASKYFKTSELYLYLGICFEEIGDFEEAKKYYKISSNIVPHKFLPKYHLVLLLDKMKLEREALLLAKEIIKTPAKINSKTVLDIKYKMRNFVKENESSTIK